MPEYMRADTTICQISALTETLEKHLYTIKRQRRAILSKEYMILIRVTYLLQLIITLTPTIQVVQQRSQSISTERDAPFLPPLSKDNKTP